jgi:hypothetical protein
MVYRGKPSAGCETCRKAKKKCTLELPACSRCVKLNKQCSGYRDTTGLQIQDETLSVTKKAERKNAQPSMAFNPGPARPKPQTATTASNTTWDDVASSRAIPHAPFVISKHDASSFPPTTLSTPLRYQQPDSILLPAHDGFDCTKAAYMGTGSGVPSPPELHSGSSSSSEDTIDYPLEDYVRDAAVTRFGWNERQQWDCNPYNVFGMMSIPTSIGPKPDDVAVSYFLNYFTADGHWDYLVRNATRPTLDPCLTLAIKACGMAALENVQYVPGGRAWSRKAYMKAIGLLNEALRDPVRSKKDESLMAVTMLSFFEVSRSCTFSTPDETDAAHRTLFVTASNLFCLGKRISRALRNYSSSGVQHS